LSYQQRPKLTEIHHKGRQLCFKCALCIILRGESLDSNVKRVTRLLVWGQLSRPASVGRPNALNSVEDSGAKLGTSLGSFRSIENQHAVEERDLCGHLDHLTPRSVVGALGRADKQPQNQGSHGSNKAHGKFHGVPGVSAEMSLRKVTMHTPAE